MSGKASAVSDHDAPVARFYAIFLDFIHYKPDRGRGHVAELGQNGPRRPDFFLGDANLGTYRIDDVFAPGVERPVIDVGNREIARLEDIGHYAGSRLSDNIRKFE